MFRICCSGRKITSMNASRADCLCIVSLFMCSVTGFVLFEVFLFFVLGARACALESVAPRSHKRHCVRVYFFKEAVLFDVFQQREEV